MVTIAGPYAQILTMSGMPLAGPLSDEKLPVIEQGGIAIQKGKVLAVGLYQDLLKNYPKARLDESNAGMVAVPGLVDAHTHICFAGSRAKDYALRVSGKSYQEILAEGGGIYDTVQKTRQVSSGELFRLTMQRADELLEQGITTIEIKTGYGLSVEQELRMLGVIKEVAATHPATIVATCLAAHVCPKEADSPQAYLEDILQNLLPAAKGLCKRVDAFVEEHAFSPEVAGDYLRKAQAMGYEITIHADQFSTLGSELAASIGAVSADHLEMSTPKQAQLLAQAGVVAVVLPGASLGLGMPMAPARMLLDSGCVLAIASDYNPGTAPQGDLLTQAAILGAAQKLTLAETWAALTFRAAAALRLPDKGRLEPGTAADWAVFPTTDYREILYTQGRMRPVAVYTAGDKVL